MKSPATNPSNRNYFVDAVRGFTMISMILYHACYDYFIAFGRDNGFLYSDAAYVWQQSICMTFILVSGMVWPFGKKHALKRGLILIGLGVVITIVTVLFIPESAIHYGILNFMGIATLLMLPLDALFRFFKSHTGCFRKHRGACILTGLILCFALFLLTRHIPNGYIGVGNQVFLKLPETLYRFPLLTPLGFPNVGFVSADYFPVIPWIFLYLCGYHLGKLLFPLKGFQRLGAGKVPLLSALGTRSLLVYIIHQPVCYGVIWLFCR